MSLSNIISVSIDRNTTTPSRAGFGTPLIAAYVPATLMPARTASYSGLGEMVTAGFKTTDPLYLAASRLFAQNPSPPTIKVGRRANAPQQVIDVVPDAPAVGKVYTVTVVGYADGAFGSRARPATTDTVSVTDTGSYVDAEDVVDAIITAFGTPGADFSVAKSGVTTSAKLVITADNTTMDGVLFGVTTSDTCSITDQTADPGIAADLTAINLYDSDWYGLVLDSNSEAEIDAASAWAQSNTKLLCWQTADEAVASTTPTADTTSIAALATEDHSVGFFHRDNFDYVCAAMLGRALPEDPGSITWAYKQLQSVTAQALNSTEQGNLYGTIDSPGGKYMNAFVSQNAISHTRFGYAKSGEFADVIRGTDWLTARIQEDVYAALLQNDRIPYTDQGIGVIYQVILSRLQDGEANGFLAPGSSTVTVPRAADVLSADKGARTLNNVTFRATLAGAIHYVAIEGELNL